ncbi:MAG: hypothetical protein QOE10_696 [Gaiellales bacterium]|jgi:hypothetical protein|nr:hypothetical protein [Gaiellales bacterium]
MLHASPAPLPKHAAAIVRLLSAPNTSGRASWNVVIKKDGSHYRLDYAWRTSGQVSIHVVSGKREVWAATKGAKAKYVCSRVRPAAPSCKPNPTVSQVTPVFLAFSWFFFDPKYLGKQFAKAPDSAVSRTRRSGFPVACVRAGTSATCVTSFGAPTLLVTPDLRLTAVSLSATPRAADFTAPKVPAADDPSLGLFA